MSSDLSPVVIPFQEEAMSPVPQGTPEWAKELMARVHHGEQQIKRDRHEARNRDMVLEGNMVRMASHIDAIRQNVGVPGDIDGNGATGVHAHLTKLDRRLRPFETMRERGMGILMAVPVAIGAVWWLIDKKVEAIFK